MHLSFKACIHGYVALASAPAIFTDQTMCGVFSSKLYSGVLW